MVFHFKTKGFILVFISAIWQGQPIDGQSMPVPAVITDPVVNGTIGETSPNLICGSLGTPFSLCIWERMNSEGSNLILTIDNARSGMISGVNGYNDIGDSLPDGQCGFRINSVKEEDFKKWQCTLIADLKVFRGYVELRNLENGTTGIKANKSSITQGSVSPIKISAPFVPARQSRQFFQSQSSGAVGLPKGRPIVTVETVSDSDFSRSLGEEAPVGLQIQEVQVQSSGLEIKQKKGRKLVIL